MEVLWEQHNFKKNLKENFLSHAFIQKCLNDWDLESIKLTYCDLDKKFYLALVYWKLS